MTCDDVGKRFEAWLDGSLDAATRDGFATHAAGCARCGPLALLVSEAAAELSRRGPAVPSADLAERAYLAALAAPPREAGFWELLLRWTAIAAPVAVAAAVVLLVGAPAGNATSAGTVPGTASLDAAAAILGDSSGFEALSTGDGVLP